MKPTHLFTLAAIIVVLSLQLGILVAAGGSPTPLGEEWLSTEQQAYARYALTQYCPRSWIIYTPWVHPVYNGRATHTTVTIYDVHAWTPYQLYCLIRHECTETLQGEIHSWAEVYEECRME